MTKGDHKQKTIWSRRLVLQAAALAGAGALLRPAAAAPAVVGVISELRGKAVAEVGNQLRELQVKSPVQLGDTLVTATDSRLKAALGGKTTLRLGADTRVKIDKFIVDSGGELVLGAGALLLDAPSGRFSKGLTVKSPFALIAVRGTRFFAGDIDGTFGVFVAKGSVDVSAGGKSVRLKAGQGTDIERAGDPPHPAKTWGKPKIQKALALVT
jgi:ferric-dicitrate binding protein FerR (iron transport regulator)